MFFFFKKPKIVVDCFTPYQSVYELFKIRKALLYYPEEIKRIPAVYKSTIKELNIDREVATIKKCEGIKDLYKTGAIITMWSDFYAQPQKASRNESVIGAISQPYSWEQHPREQYPGLFNDYLHVKLGGVWYINESSGIKWVWQNAYWNQLHHLDHYTMQPAIINYLHQSQTNVNIMIKKTSEDFIIKAGEPLVHIIPLTEKEVEYKCHIVSIDEWSRSPISRIPEDFGNISFGRYSNYIKHKKRAEQFDEQEKPKCPFGFGK